MGSVKIKQNTPTLLYSIDKSVKVIYINWTNGKGEKKIYVYAVVTGIKNINQKLTSTLLR